MNPEKLKNIESQVRIGGKGTPRRKRKIVRGTQMSDKKLEKNLQRSIEKLKMETVPCVDDVNIHKEDGSIIHLNNPKIQADIDSNIWAITGYSQILKPEDVNEIMVQKKNTQPEPEPERVPVNLSAYLHYEGPVGELGDEFPYFADLFDE